MTQISLTGAGPSATGFSPSSYGARLKAWWDPDVSFTNVKQAASFTAANTEYLSIPINATLKPGDNDFWVSMEVSVGSKAAQRNIVGQYDSGINKRAFSVYYLNTNDRFQFTISKDGTSGDRVDVVANNFGSPSTNTKYNIVVWYDAVLDLAYISVNNGTPDSGSHAGGVFDTDVAFQIGAMLTSNNPNLPFEGTIDNVFFGKSPVGGIAAQITDIRNTLYNSGNGVGYDDVSSAQKTAWGLVSCWELDEYSAGTGAVTRNDRHGTNHLTDNNTVPSAVGLVTNSISDNDPIFQQLDRSGNACTVTQATLAKQPLYDTTIDSDGFIKFDGSNDILAHTAADAISTASSGEFYAVIRPSSVTGTQCIFCTADESVADKFLSIQLNGTFLEVAQNEAGTENRVTAGTTALSIGTSYVIGVISTGTAWELRVNGITQNVTVASGSNNGNWFGDTTGRDSATLGGRKTTTENTFFNGYIGEAFLIDP